MKVNFLSENIQPFIGLLGRVLSPHAQIPVLSSVLLEATGDGLVLSATDLEFGVRVKIPAKTEEEGGVLVPGKQILEILASLPHEKTSLSQEKDTLVLKTNSNSFSFQSLPKEEFPKLFEEKGERAAEFTGAGFADIFGKLVYAVSQDESRPHLTGVHIAKKEGGVDMVATDGFRLSLKKNTGAGEGIALSGVTISQRLVSEGLSLKEADKITLYIHPQNNQAILEAPNVLLIGRLIEGSYPDYERVLPKELKTALTVDKESLVKSLRTVSVFARENANVVNLSATNGVLELKANPSSLGEADAQIDCLQKGEDVSIAFNIKFLQDFLKNISEKQVVIRINSAFDPAQLEIPEDKNFLHVIMPVRVQD
ncbi:MAG: DNA polymerase III subunit beta [Candidatus Levyibacteriota bacterium]